MTDVVLPDLGSAGEWSGDAVHDIEVGRWLVEDGSRVSAGDSIVEVVLDKVEAAIEAPASGVLRQLVGAGEIVSAGDVLATIDPDADGAPG